MFIILLSLKRKYETPLQLASATSLSRHLRINILNQAATRKSLCPEAKKRFK